MTEFELLKEIQFSYQEILGSKLTGIYVHGSIAFGCFRWEVSDIDFLVVVNAPLEQQEKETLILELLKLDAFAPPKGFEMSVVLDSVCAPFLHPTPFELHFSNTHKQRCRENVREYCRTMNGTDPDLAAHCTVIRQVGQVLCGKPIEAVFAEVPRENYLDSILGDIREAPRDIVENPVYFILNLCRVLAFVKDGMVLSEEQGGTWGIQNLNEGTDCIRSARNAYLGIETFSSQDGELKTFAEMLLTRIHQYI